jgi:hypothetical protein
LSGKINHPKGFQGQIMRMKGKPLIDQTIHIPVLLKLPAIPVASL